MRALKHIGIAIVICMAVCFLAIGFQVWFDLSTREDDVLTYTRLAMKNALVNIQTTEQEGYNFVSSGKSSSYTYNSANYNKYLIDLLNQTNASGDENMKAVKQFLEVNIQDKTDDALFRPIQFGMTYVDKELFEESFNSSIQDLVDANYNKANNYETAGVSFTTKAPNALKINNCNINIDGPKLGAIPTRDDEVDPIYKSIYGIDRLEQEALKQDLGFVSSAINFYVYYDIDVTVDWSSASANQLMTRNFFTALADKALNAFANHNRVRSDLEYTPAENGAQEYLYIPGKPVTYSYRYVLTN